MLGAVFGDIVGSAYEWNNVKTKDFPLERPETRYTDDSVMTLAVAKWLLEDPSHSESHLVTCMQKLGRGHFKAGYGGSFREWLMSKDPKPYNSWGNGSAMRVSPVALYANSLEEALELARTTAIVTHNHPEGVKGAMAVAECVYICREAADVDKAKREIRDSIPRKYGYNLQSTLDEIRPDYKFDVSCQGSVPEAIIAFLESNSLEDCVRNAISIGGDSDTIAAIACSIYSAKNNQEDDILAKRFEHYLPADLLRIMEAFEKRIRNRRPIENSYQVTSQRDTPDTIEQRDFIAKFIREKQSGRKTSINVNTDQRKDVKRFLEAQNAVYNGFSQALEEVRNGRKTSHWIWYIFPQMKGLGHSRMSEFYGIEDWEEAEDYLLNYTLNDRIHEISEALLQHKGKSVYRIFGEIDAMKVQSSMTLFDALSPNDVFGKVLDQFYAGVRDKRTLELIHGDEDELSLL